jgi:hypothetical protein
MDLRNTTVVVAGRGEHPAIGRRLRRGRETTSSELTTITIQTMLPT